MQFITSGNRIAVENFTVGYLYTITFTNGNYIYCACTGIGIDFVMFSRTAPEYTFALTMETAADVSAIEIYSEGGGTTNYNELTNKPQINSVTLTGNLSLADLGIQPVINADNMLSYTLVSGLGTAATTAASDYATAAQGALAATAVQPADLNAYQTKIDSSNKLSADLVDDTSTTNKFATAAQLSQIETNKTNISSGLSGCRLLANINDRDSYTFTFPKRDATTTRYRFGLIMAGVSAAGTSLFAIFADTNNDVTINKIAGTTSRTFTGAISYSGDDCTLTLTPNDTQYGGIRVIWFD